ncbi:ATP-binding protein [Mucilaginibacter gynuensis]|uniref:histidine kinase n=1 Tax=Mucilaginibacter gynuensis TaxID=1302236 RepID=A0ABP8GIJ9_9SPHI
MSEQLIDLTNCDREPIHIPGQIQSHGFFIVVDDACFIRFYSENVFNFLPSIPTDLLGRHIQDIEPLIGKNEPPDFINQLLNFGRGNKSFDQTNPFQTDIQGKPFYLIISKADNYFVLEFETATSDMNLDLQKMIGRSISEMLADKNLQHLLNNSARQVKQVIGYDRVMIYRFAEDGHGEVLAEAKNDDLEPWLGLHYPASDIPKQARELYKVNLTRLIANVHTTPSKVVTSANFGTTPLNLTHSQLRAVSPIHIQYLKNMGVDSSFSISLLYKGELWGLIACHNYTPRFIDFKTRESSKLIGQILSSALEFRQDEENQQLHERFVGTVDKLSKYMLKTNSIEDALTRQDSTILEAVNAEGVVLLYENNIIKQGKVPADEQIRELTAWLTTHVNEPVYYTDHLSAAYPAAEAYKHVASGVMVTTLSRELGEYVIWFKPEQLQTITWAGNPDKPAELQNDGTFKISPRHSFEAWSQTVVNKSTPWLNEEVKSVIRLKEEIMYAINQKAGAIRLLNERLKQAYEELDTFSFTISHDLKNPLSAIKSYSQLLTRDTTLKPEAQKVLDRIVNRADRMNYMINEVLDYSRIGRSDIEFTKIEVAPIINDIAKELGIVYDTEKLQLNIGATPDIQGDPLMISQVFANLLSNAVKYSGQSDPQIVSIEGRETEGGIIYSISDNGLGIDIKQLPQIFELFKRMDNVQDIEGSGVGLAIVKRIIEKHKGKIWVDSELGRGTTFHVEFSN